MCLEDHRGQRMNFTLPIQVYRWSRGTPELCFGPHGRINIGRKHAGTTMSCRGLSPITSIPVDGRNARAELVGQAGRFLVVCEAFLSRCVPPPSPWARITTC